MLNYSTSLKSGSMCSHALSGLYRVVDAIQKPENISNPVVLKVDSRDLETTFPPKELSVETLGTGSVLGGGKTTEPVQPCGKGAFTLGV